MKRIIVFGALLTLTLSVLADNCFQEGAKWKVVYDSNDGRTCHGPGLHWLEDASGAGDGVMKMMYCDTAFDEPGKEECEIRSEGEKVYFRPKGKDEWYLIYDFGLKPGEGCYIYSSCEREDLLGQTKVYVKCESVEDNVAEVGGRSLMKMVQYGDESCKGYGEKGNWIKGIGGLSDPLINIFGLSGARSSLQLVWQGDKLVYRSNFNKSEYTRWLSLKTALVSGVQKSWLETEVLEKSEEDNGTRVVNAYIETDGAERRLIGEVKRVDEKVYYRLDATPDWLLLYDFSLMPGQGCYVSSPYAEKSDFGGGKCYVKCVGIDIDTDYAPRQVMKMEQYLDESCAVKTGEIEWLRRVGSKQGFLANVAIADGVERELREAGGANSTYCSYASGNYFRPGTRWVSEVEDAVNPSVKRREIVKVERMDASSPFEWGVYRSIEPTPDDFSLVGYVKTFGSEVMFRTADGSSGWKRLYEFNMFLMETLDFIYPGDFSQGSSPQNVNIDCVGFATSDYGWRMAGVAKSGEYGSDKVIWWLQNLSSVYGPLRNVKMEGAPNAELVEVYDRELLVYNHSTGDVPTLSDASEADVLKSVYTIQGVKLYDNATDEQISGLAPGLYIIAGKKVVK